MSLLKKILLWLGCTLLLCVIIALAFYIYLQKRIQVASSGAVTAASFVCDKATLGTRTTPVVLVPDIRSSGDSGTVPLVRGLPRIFGEVGSYDEVLAKSACQGPTYVFSYDWRALPDKSTASLVQFLRGVKGVTNITPKVIAHGTGGLLVYATLAKQPELADKVVYAGVPFAPGLAYLNEMDITSGKFPVYYALLPHPGSNFYKNYDLFDAYYWKAYKLPPLAPGVLTEEELENQLAEAKKFLERLDQKISLPQTLLFVVGNCTDTLESINPNDSQNLVKGDGYVRASGAKPLGVSSLKSSEINTCKKHNALLDDSQVVAKILEFVK